MARAGLALDAEEHGAPGAVQVPGRERRAVEVGEPFALVGGDELGAQLRALSFRHPRGLVGNLAPEDQAAGAVRFDDSPLGADADDAARQLLTAQAACLAANGCAGSVPLPEGVMVYSDQEKHLEPLAATKVQRAEVIDELYAAVVDGEAPLHDGEWALATTEACLAILQSAREQKEIALRNQTGLRT